MSSTVKSESYEGTSKLKPLSRLENTLADINILLKCGQENRGSPSSKTLLIDTEWVDLVCRSVSSEDAKESSISLRIIDAVATGVKDGLEISKELKDSFFTSYKDILAPLLLSKKSDDWLQNVGYSLLISSMQILLHECQISTKLINMFLRVIQSWMNTTRGNVSFKLSYDAFVDLVLLLEPIIEQLDPRKALLVLQAISNPFLSSKRTNKLENLGSRYLKALCAFWRLVRTSAMSEEHMEKILLHILMFFIGDSESVTVLHPGDDPIVSPSSSERAVCQPVKMNFVLNLLSANHETDQSPGFLTLLTHSHIQSKFFDFISELFTGRIGGTNKGILRRHAQFLAQCIRFAYMQFDQASEHVEKMFALFGQLAKVVEKEANNIELAMNSVYYELIATIWFIPLKTDFTVVQNSVKLLLSSSFPGSLVDSWTAFDLLRTIVNRFKNDKSSKLSIDIKLFEIVHRALSEVPPKDMLNNIAEWIHFIIENMEIIPTAALIKAWKTVGTNLIRYRGMGSSIGTENMVFEKIVAMISMVFKVAARKDYDSDLSSVMPVLGCLIAEAQTSISNGSDDAKPNTLMIGTLKTMPPLGDTVAELALHVGTLSTLCEKVPFDALSENMQTGAVTFDVLGDARLLVSKLASALQKANSLVESTEKLIESSKISMIDGCSRAKDIIGHIRTLLATIVTSMEKIEKSNMVTAIFQTMAQPLAEVLELASTRSKSQYFKDLQSGVVGYIAQVLQCVQKKLCGPYDSELLASIDQLLAACFSHSNKELQLATVKLWKATFEDSQELSYSTALRKSILAAQKRHLIKAPGIVSSKMNLDDTRMAAPLTTPNSKNKTVSTKSSSKKRAMTLLDEDSVDYVVIKPTNSAKKMRLTEHQKELFNAARDKLPYMDEDSQQFVSAKKVPVQFDAESSMSASLSVSNAAKSKRLSADLSTASAPVSAPVVVAKKDETSNSGVVKKRASAVKLNFEKCAAKPVEVVDLTSQALPPMDDEDSGDENEPLPMIDESVSSQDSASSIEPLIEDNETVTIDSESADSECGSSSSMAVLTSAGSADSVRSRRNQAKGTPSKYTKAAKASKADTSSKKEKKAVSGLEKIKRPRGRPRKSLPVSLETENDTTTEKSSASSRVGRKSAVVVSSLDCDSIPLSELVKRRKTEEKAVKGKKESEETEKHADSRESKGVAKESTEVLSAAASVENASPVSSRSSEVVLSEENMTTPVKNGPSSDTFTGTPSTRRVVEASTPGILKKIGSPLTSGRKRLRVHFNNESNSSSDDNVDPAASAAAAATATGTGTDTSADSPATPKGKMGTGSGYTPRRPFATSELAKTPVISTPGSTSSKASSLIVETGTPSSVEDLDCPLASVYPALVGNRDPVTKIISKMLPIHSTNGSLFLRRNMQQKGIITIGDLARMCRKDAASLVVKHPRLETVYNALKDYAEALEKDSSSVQVARIPVVTAPVETAVPVEDTTEKVISVGAPAAVNNTQETYDSWADTVEYVPATPEEVTEKTSDGDEDAVVSGGETVMEVDETVIENQSAITVSPTVAMPEETTVTREEESTPSPVDLDDSFDSPIDETILERNEASFAEDKGLSAEPSTDGLTPPPVPVTTSEEIADAQPKSINNELLRFSELCSSLVAGFPENLTNDQLKEILNHTNKAMDAVCSLQRETFKRIN